MDNSLRVWDIRPFAPQERCIKMMVGHAHNFEKVHNIADELFQIDSNAQYISEFTSLFVVP